LNYEKVELLQIYVTQFFHGELIDGENVVGRKMPMQDISFSILVFDSGKVKLQKHNKNTKEVEIEFVATTPKEVCVKFVEFIFNNHVIKNNKIS